VLDFADYTIEVDPLRFAILAFWLRRDGNR